MSPSLRSSPSSDSEFDDEDSFAAYLEESDEGYLDAEDRNDTARSRSRSAHRTRLEITSKRQFTELIHTYESREGLGTLYPKSLWHENFTSKKYETEEILLAHLPPRAKRGKRVSVTGDTFVEIPLSNFSIYNAYSSPQFPGMFENLHTVANECKGKGLSTCCIDGVFDNGNGNSFITGMIIRDVSIGGLDDVQCHTARQTIWIQTETCKRKDDCWYHLTAPAPEYNKFWQDFLWLADLTKHCIDFLCSKAEVHLDDFRTSFNEFITKHHEGQLCFDEWKARGGTISDFRRVVIRHREFLKNQAYNICPANLDSEHQDLLAHPLWCEIGLDEGYRAKKLDNTPTILTPRVAQIFLKAYPEWAPEQQNTIQVMDPCGGVVKQREFRRSNLAFPDKYAGIVDKCYNVSTILEEAASHDHQCIFNTKDLIRKVVLIKDKLATERQSIRIRSGNISRARYSFTFGLVLSITKNQKAIRVVWLVTPGKSVCGGHHGTAYYPIVNELFLVDKCNCHTVDLSNIVGVFEASLFKSSAERSLLIRSRFKSDCSLVDAFETELNAGCQDPSCDKLAFFTGTSHTITSETVVPLEESKAPALHSFSLFSGCGLFDKGLEDYGTIETLHSIDCDGAAIKSIRANDMGKKQQILHDSVDSLLGDYLTGRKPYTEPDVCTAGCPCQGFSDLNSSKNNAKSRKNCSLLASTLSFIDLFLPWYVIIENVPAMDHSSTACAQAICTLVALGYQVRKVFLRASGYGGCTTRQRLFILAAAPGFKLPRCPTPTHGEGPILKKIITAKEASEDIAPISNDTLINICYPDHIPLVRHKLIFRESDTINLRDLVHRIPAGLGLVSSYQHLSQIQKDWFRSYKSRNPGKMIDKSRIYKRINPDKPFPTITTKITSTDCYHTGETLHYDQDRTITLEEIRRAQGVPDSFILVGSLEDQQRQVGNGVPWALGSAIGRVVGEAYQQTWNRRKALVVGNGVHGESKDQEGGDTNGDVVITTPKDEDEKMTNGGEDEKGMDELKGELIEGELDDDDGDEVIFVRSRSFLVTRKNSKGCLEDPILLSSDDEDGDEDVEMT